MNEEDDKETLVLFVSRITYYTKTPHRLRADEVFSLGLFLQPLFF